MHLRFSQYKMKTPVADQETRRARMLEHQKSKRDDLVSSIGCWSLCSQQWSWKGEPCASPGHGWLWWGGCGRRWGGRDGHYWGRGSLVTSTFAELAICFFKGQAKALEENLQEPAHALWVVSWGTWETKRPSWDIIFSNLHPNFRSRKTWKPLGCWSSVPRDAGTLLLLPMAPPRLNNCPVNKSRVEIFPGVQ